MYPLFHNRFYLKIRVVDPAYQGKGIGKMLYAKREALVKEKKLLRIRAGARLSGYVTYANELSPDDYVIEVIKARIFDPILMHDSESLGYAAVIEWINTEVAHKEDYFGGLEKFRMKSPLFKG